MHISRLFHLVITYLPRMYHRHGYNIQSPSDYELVKNVLYEKLAYYAYDDQRLNTRVDKLKYRLKLRFGDSLVCADSTNGSDVYSCVVKSKNQSSVLFVEDISGANYHLWQEIVSDSNSRITFDMGTTGLVLFDSKRIKQNYLL